MSRKSKVLLLVLILLIIFTFLGMSKKEESKEERVEQFESELLTPDNNLAEEENKVNSNQFLLRISSGLESFIIKIFEYIIAIIKSITGSFL